MKPHSKIAFSWVELLVLVAILGVLAAILIPTVGRVRDPGRRSIDASNIRQIGQAAWIYASDNQEQLPGLSLNQEGRIDENSRTPNIHAIAAALARDGGANVTSLWFSPGDQNPDVNQRPPRVVLENHPQGSLSSEFAASALSFQFIAGLNQRMPSTTPIALTRGLEPGGRWARDRNVSVHGRDGGHIVFLAGNVRFFKDLREEDGQLKALEGATTANILKTIDSSQRIFSYPATPTGAVDGMPGIGGR